MRTATSQSTKLLHVVNTKSSALPPNSSKYIFHLCSHQKNILSTLFSSNSSCALPFVSLSVAFHVTLFDHPTQPFWYHVSFCVPSAPIPHICFPSFLLPSSPLLFSPSPSCVFFCVLIVLWTCFAAFLMVCKYGLNNLLFPVHENLVGLKNMSSTVVNISDLRTQEYPKQLILTVSGLRNKMGNCFFGGRQGDYVVFYIFRAPNLRILNQVIQVFMKAATAGCRLSLRIDSRDEFEFKICAGRGAILILTEDFFNAVARTPEEELPNKCAACAFPYLSDIFLKFPCISCPLKFDLDVFLTPNQGPYAFHPFVKVDWILKNVSTVMIDGVVFFEFTFIFSDGSHAITASECVRANSAGMAHLQHANVLAHLHADMSEMQLKFSKEVLCHSPFLKKASEQQSSPRFMGTVVILDMSIVFTPPGKNPCVFHLNMSTMRRVFDVTNFNETKNDRELCFRRMFFMHPINMKQPIETNICTLDNKLNPAHVGDHLSVDVRIEKASKLKTSGHLDFLQETQVEILDGDKTIKATLETKCPTSHVSIKSKTYPSTTCRINVVMQRDANGTLILRDHPQGCLWGERIDINQQWFFNFILRYSNADDCVNYGILTNEEMVSPNLHPLRPTPSQPSPMTLPVGQPVVSHTLTDDERAAMLGHFAPSAPAGEQSSKRDREEDDVASDLPQHKERKDDHADGKNKKQ